MIRLLASLALLLGAGAPAGAVDLPKQITILVGFAAGQGTDLASGGDPTSLMTSRLTAEPTYDQAAQFYARHLGRFLPGEPTVNVRLAPGAASLVAAAQLARGRVDGSQLAIIGPATLFASYSGAPKLPPPHWIGARQKDDDVCIVRADLAIKDIADLRKRETFMAALSPLSRSNLYPRALNELAGTKFKIIPGYGSDFEIARAIENGEAEGWCGWSMQSLQARHPSLLRDGKVRAVIQFTRTPSGEGLQIPRASDLVTGAAREVMQALASQTRLGAFALAAPAGMAPDLVATFRAAFAAMLKDPSVLDEAARLGFEVDPVSGEELDRLTAEFTDMSPPAKDLLRMLLHGP
jgi:tripartite-type tricarboxylate transporter receptor subunit TctC